MSRRPRASGYFRTAYAQDLALIETRTERLALAALLLALVALPILRLAVPARSGHAGAARQRRRTGADAAHGLRRPGIAGACGVAGGRRLHRRHPVQGAAGTVLGHAAGCGYRRRADRRGVRPAVAAPARPVLGGQHAGVAFSRRLSRRRVRDQARLLDRHRHRPAVHHGACHHRWPRLVSHRCWRPPRQRLLLCLNLLRSKTGRAWAAIRANETVAEALGIGVAAHKLLAFVISSAHHGGGRRAVCLLSRLRLRGGLLAVPVDPVRGDDHRRRHGIAARGRARAPSSSRSFPTSSRPACAPCPVRSATPACCLP